MWVFFDSILKKRNKRTRDNNPSMASSRQRLINASSFLSNQKEQIGGLNVKRSTITADSFKKGTSQESSDNIKERVTANEKKITLLKNIVKLRKQNVDKPVSYTHLTLPTKA